MVNPVPFADNRIRTGLWMKRSIQVKRKSIILPSSDMTTLCPQERNMDDFFPQRIDQENCLVVRCHDAAEYCLALVDIFQVRELLAQNERLLLARLSPEERQYTGRFRFARRHHEWLSGRLAAKAAMLRTADGIAAQYAADEITILADEHGRPCCTVPDGSRISQLSISHSRRYAVAMAAEKECGVDIQRIEPRISRVGDRICSREELHLAGQVLAGSLEEALTLIWSGKEALKKCSLHDRPGLFEAIIVEKIEVLPGQCWNMQCRLVGNIQQKEVSVVMLNDYMLAWCGG